MNVFKLYTQKEIDDSGNYQITFKDFSLYPDASSYQSSGGDVPDDVTYSIADRRFAVFVIKGDQVIDRVIFNERERAIPLSPTDAVGALKIIVMPVATNDAATGSSPELITPNGLERQYYYLNSSGDAVIGEVENGEIRELTDADIIREYDRRNQGNAVYRYSIIRNIHVSSVLDICYNKVVYEYFKQKQENKFNDYRLVVIQKYIDIMHTLKTLSDNSSVDFFTHYKIDKFLAFMAEEQIICYDNDVVFPDIYAEFDVNITNSDNILPSITF